VKVQTYDNTYKGDLFSIDKKRKTIYLGYEKIQEHPYQLHFETETTLSGYLRVYNTSKLEIYNLENTERTYIRVNDGGVYFMGDKDSTSSVDIVFPKGLRFKSDESLKIMK
jgi:hypothetical protein